MLINPKSNYIVLLICISSLLTIGWSPFAFTLILFFITYIAIKRLYFTIKYPNEIELGGFFSLSLIISYMVSSLTVQLRLFDNYGLFSYNYFNINQYSLSFVTALILSSGIILDYVGTKKPFIIRFNDFKNVNFSPTSDIFIKVLMFLIVFSYLTGKIGFANNTLLSEDTTDVSIIGSIASSSMIPIGALCLISTRCRDISKLNKYIYIIFSIIIFILVLTQGRRIFTTLVLFYCITLSFFFDILKINLKNLLILLILFLSIKIGTTFYEALRVSSFNFKGSSFSDIVEGAMYLILNPEIGDLDTRISDNLIERPFVILFMVEMYEKLGLWGNGILSFGMNIWNSFLWTVPRFILPNKNFIIDEDYFQITNGLPQDDTPWSLSAAGLLDFGTLGILFLPCVYLQFVRYIYSVTYKNFDIFFKFYIFINLLFIFSSVEGSTSFYLSYLRGIAIAYFIYYLISIFYKKL